MINSLNIIEFFNTYTLDDLYSTLGNLSLETILSNWGYILLFLLVVALLYTPWKSWIASTLFYFFSFLLLFVIFVILKNSNLSPQESFIIFGGGFLGVIGFYVYIYLIR